jgi:epsin
LGGLDNLSNRPNNRVSPSPQPPGPPGGIGGGGGGGVRPQVKTKAELTASEQHLASLFANREDDGLDTFGNIGTLRYVVFF